MFWVASNIAAFTPADSAPSSRQPAAGRRHDRVPRPSGRGLCCGLELALRAAESAPRRPRPLVVQPGAAPDPRSISATFRSSVVYPVTATSSSTPHANGKRDPGEPGVPGFDVLIKTARTTCTCRDRTCRRPTPGCVRHQGGLSDHRRVPHRGFLQHRATRRRRHRTRPTTIRRSHTTLTAAVDLSVNPISARTAVSTSACCHIRRGDPCDDTCQGGIVANVAYDAPARVAGPQGATDDYEPGVPL